LEIVLTSTQDKCTDWDEHTIVSETILGTNDSTLGDAGQMEARFGLFGDCAILDTR
jgi:hypothetical protein